VEKLVVDSVLKAFSEDHVVRLTGLSRSQLRAWDKIGFFQPDFACEDRHQPYSRIYSFQDVVGLRTIAVLRQQYRISLQQLRKVAQELTARGFGHWAEIKLYVVKGQVHFRRPGSGDVEGVWDGQLAMVPVIEVIQDVEVRVRDLRQRTSEQRGQVERHKYVVRNAAVIAGTRIPTAAIRRFREAGYSVDQIIRQYPTLSKEDVEAAIAHEEGLAQSA
jgi:uncharacterized protein (DUF433 family)